MSSTILLIVLLSAHITGLISEQLLKATVGGSVLIPCSLPAYPLTFFWQEGKEHFFHWENGKRKEALNKNYQNRSQIFPSEFSSGNFSFRLDNISPEDNNTTFFAFVKLDKQKPSERRCRSTLQVSAPYQDLNLTVNHTTNSATCSARGGYPAAQVSWKGLNRSSDEEQDLQDAETSPQEDPTEKTFSFTSSVNVTGLKSVTCIVYNPHSHESRTRTKKINTDPLNPTSSVSTPEEGSSAAVIVGSVLGILFLIAILAGAVLFYLRYRSQHQAQAPAPAQAQEPDPAPAQAPARAQEPAPAPAQAPARAQAQAQAQAQAPAPAQAQAPAPAQAPAQAQAPAPAQAPARAPAPVQALDPAQAQEPDPANPPSVHSQAEDADAAEPAQDPVQEEADPSEDTVLLSEDRAVYHCQTKTSEGTADCDTCEDAAASPEKEKLLEKENGNEDSASD